MTSQLAVTPDFSKARLALRYNTDLANGLGNLTNRTLNMVNLYRDGALKRPASMTELRKRDAEAQALTDPSGIAERLRIIRVSIGVRFRPAYEAAMQAFQLEKAISEILAYASQADSLIEHSAPWKLVKLPEKAEELDNVLYHLAEALRIVAILISPVLPKAAHAIFDQLNWK